MPRTKTTLEYLAYAIFIVVILSLPAFFDEFWLNRVAKYLVYGILGVAIAMSWGYAGILNLGQGLFFGAGAYMIAMSLKLQSRTSMSQGADTPIPDFMIWNAEPGAPIDLCCINPGSWLWIPFESTWFGVMMGILLPVLIATAIGLLIFKKRVAGVYVSIITLALVLLVRLVVIDAQPLTNGFNGLTDLAYLTVFGIEFDPYMTNTYYLVAISLAVVLILARFLVSTRAGLVLQAIRDDQNRARYLGFDVPLYQTAFFAVSAAIAGFAGMLYVLVAEFASPTFMDLTFSITMVIWAAVGGRASLLGAAIGAILINYIEASASETRALVQAWPVVLGVLFIVAVLFLPRGLAGLVSDATDRVLSFFNRRKPDRREPEPARDPAPAE